MPPDADATVVVVDPQVDPKPDAVVVADAKTGDEGEAKTTDYSEEAHKAYLELHRGEIEAEARERFQTELRETNRQAIDQRAVNDVDAQLDTTAKTIESVLMAGVSVPIEDAETGVSRQVKVTMSETQAKELVRGPLSKLIADAGLRLKQGAYEELADFADELLPDPEAKKTFMDLGHDKAPAEWLKAFAEVRATKTDAWTAREKAWALEKAQAEAVAFTEGQKTPLGQPRTSTGTGAGTGPLTTDKWNAMSPSERAEAWKSKPEEVRALR